MASVKCNCKEQCGSLPLLLTESLNIACALLQEAAQLVGRKIAELCLSKSIEKVAFDRGGHVYHGRIKVGGSLMSWTAITSANPNNASASASFANRVPHVVCRRSLMPHVKEASTSEKNLVYKTRRRRQRHHALDSILVDFVCHTAFLGPLIGHAAGVSSVTAANIASHDCSSGNNPGHNQSMQTCTSHNQTRLVIELKPRSIRHSVWGR